MRILLLFLGILFLSTVSLAVRTGQLSVTDADVYKSSNFDSDIVTNIRQGEAFFVSEKAYDGFYKIKLKSGVIGFVPDHEIAINGRVFEEKPYVDESREQELMNRNKKIKNAKSKKEKEKIEDDPDEDHEDDVFDSNLKGLSLQIINFHEDTLGSVQVDDLLAIGYKNLTDVSYEVFAAFKAPKYYSEKTFGSASGFHVWGAYGINNLLPLSGATALRYGASMMAHYSQIKVDTSVRTYDLQDLSVGVILEGGMLLRFKKAAVDFSVKYFFDRNNYAAFGLSLLF